MPENTYRESPFVSPDSIRQKLHIDKAFFDMHTPKQFGREDINGSQYAGTVENFGSEILIESRKMRMMKPALNFIWRNANVDHWFHMEHADEISTYNQMNMFTLILKEDVVCEGHRPASQRYPKLIFKNRTTEFILRSEEDSDVRDQNGDIVPSPVMKSMFFTTTRPPILKYGDDEYTLQVRDPHDGLVKYGVYVDDLTDFPIDSDYEITLNETFVGMPCIWIWLESFNTLPEIKMRNNIDQQNMPLLTVGSNNIGQTFLYPYTYFYARTGDNEYTHVNLPTNDIHEECTWQIRVYARDHLFMIPGLHFETNMNVDIEEIKYVQFKGDFTASIPFVHTIQFPKNDHIHITLNPDLNWQFRQPHVRDIDYDGVRYRNFIYGYLDNITEVFKDNPFEPENGMLPLLRVHFDDDYCHEYKTLMENSISGVHVDYTSDYSDHGIIKKDGVSYNLSEFDGLPYYCYEIYPPDIKHPRVTLYAIRDYVTKRNQQITDKHVSALLVDGGMPNFINKNRDTNSESVIKYVTDGSYKRTYRAIDNILYPTNAVSDMGYVPPDSELYRSLNVPEGTLVIADVTIPEYQSLDKRFIYHGNRTFSTDSVDFDPYLETARVYYVSNDPCSYENNATTNMPKPPRTMARICDIPTDFGQLIHLDGYSPTFVCDEKYIRSECDYTISDADRIQDLNIDIHYVYTHRYIEDPLPVTLPHFIIDSDEELNMMLPYRVLIESYNRKPYDSLSPYLQMPNLDETYITNTTETPGDDGYTFHIIGTQSSEESGYDVGDIISITIMSITLDFQVTNITDGNITLIGYQNNTYNKIVAIPFSNLEELVHTYPTTLKRKSQNATHGSNITNPIQLELIISPVKWGDMQGEPVLLSNLFTIVRDESGNLLEYQYDADDNCWVKGCIISGADLVNNPYDMTFKIPNSGESGDNWYTVEYHRDVNNILFYNILTIEPAMSNDYTYDKLLTIWSCMSEYGYIDTDMNEKFYEYILDPPTDDTDPDYSTYWNIINLSNQLTKKIQVDDTSDYYERELDLSGDIVNARANFANGYYLMHKIDDTTRRLVPLYVMTNKLTYNPKLFPEYHHAIISHYQPASNEFTRLDEELFTYDQPELILYNPYKTTYTDYIRLCGDLYEVEEIPITYADLVLSDAFVNNSNYRNECKRMQLIDSRQHSDEGMVLKENVYKFDLYKLPSAQTMIGGLLRNGDEEALLSYIKQMISKTALPVIYENTDYAFDRNMLVSYILENLPRKYAYDQNIHDNSVYISKIASVEDKVVQQMYNGRYEPTHTTETVTSIVKIVLTGDNPPSDWSSNYYMDKEATIPVESYTPGEYYKKFVKEVDIPTEQPTGEYYSVTRRVFHEKHHINHSTYEASPLFILKLNDDFRLLDNFHMIDDITGNDISKYTLLIHNNTLYMYDATNDTWKPISRKKEV